MAAITCALIGAGASYLLQDQLIDQQVEVAREERHSRALGAARLMQTEFQIRHDDLVSTLHRKRFSAVVLEVPRELSEDARRAVAERMPSEDWEKVLGPR